VFRGFTHAEAGPFLEWLGFEEIDGKKEYTLNLRMTAQRKANRIVTDVRAGPDESGTTIEGEARARLRVTFLKPLRDAENELTAGRRSRFAQILRAHPHFQKTVVEGVQQPHRLEKIIAAANEAIEKHFQPGKKKDEETEASALLRAINDYLDSFFAQGDVRSAEVKIAGSDLADISQRLELSLEENPTGLGTLNLLYIAAELLLLQGSAFQGLRLAMIEELEAHLHPQAQLRLIQFLTHKGGSGQYILTTHSTTLGATADLKKVIICRGEEVFPVGPTFTQLVLKNYEFLHRFLDATKANLFFARGVILVEGDAENLLIPTIAAIIGRPLHWYGVSLVNIGSTAFTHYEKIFLRRSGESMGIRVAVVTDLDVMPLEWYKDGEDSPNDVAIEAEKERQRLKPQQNYDDPNVKRFISPNWTLEYEISLSKFRKPLYQAVLWAQKKQNAKTGEPKEGKWQEVIAKVKNNLDSWESEWKTDGRYRQKIAWKIYGETMLDYKISKAIVAQEFASLLTHCSYREEPRDTFLKSKSLGYLVEAICHVTEPFSETFEDEVYRS
jgi:putative ATP-dependent endonuclease of OLD family